MKPHKYHQPSCLKAAPFQDFFLLKKLSSSCSNTNPEGYIHHYRLALDLEESVHCILMTCFFLFIFFFN